VFHAIDVEPEWPDEAARPVRSRLHKFKGIYEKFQKGLVARLKEARLAAGLSQQQVAEWMGTRQNEISKIESGQRRILAAEVAYFALLYETTIAYLYGLEPGPRRTTDVGRTDGAAETASDLGGRAAEGGPPALRRCGWCGIPTPRDDRTD